MSGFSQFPEKEVEARTDFMRNPVTGTIWKLTIKGEEIMIEVQNFSFQIYPLSLKKFRPMNPNMNLEIEFEEHGPHAPLLMHVYAKGINRATFESL